MDLIRNLRERRLPQFLSGYVAIGWGLVQFITFLEGRMGFSPNIVNLLSLALICLLPAVAILAWRQGRPGPDGWGRVEMVSIPANLVLAAAVLFFVFQGQDFRAVAETVTVTDENGETVEHTVVNGAYRRHLILFYLDNKGPEEDNWLRQGFTVALATDLSQNPGLDPEQPLQRVANLRQMGFESGLDLSRPLQRKIAQDAHTSYFVSGSFQRQGDDLVVDLSLHDTDKGTVVAQHQATGPDMFALVDGMTIFLLENLELPDYLLEQIPDQPVADVLSDSPEALKAFVEALVLITHEANWDDAGPAISRAVEMDPTFAMAHFMAFGIHFTNGDVGAAETASQEAMKYLYRVSERSQFQIKALYYHNVKSDPDKAMAVLEMWAQLYPNDVAAQMQIVQFAVMRGDLEKALLAYDRILEIDPGRHQVLQEAANLLRLEGRYEEAEAKLLRYADLYPGEVRSYARLVDLYDDMGQLDKAKEAAEKSLLIEPDDPATMLQLVDLEKKLGHFDEAARILEQVLDGNPVGMVHADAIEAQANLQGLRGQWKDARATYEHWREVAGRAMVAPTQATLGYAFNLSTLATSVTAPQVLADLDALVPELTPPNDQILGMCRAQVRLAQGQLDQALADLAETEELIETYKLERLRVIALMVKGQVAEKRGEYEEAAALMREAVALAPTGKRTTIILGRILREAGQPDESREVLEGVLKGYPSNPDAMMQLGLTLRAMGQGVQGEAYLLRVAEMWRDADADHPGAVELRELGLGI